MGVTERRTTDGARNKQRDAFPLAGVIRVIKGEFIFP
jgi:hypothetical protein